MGESRVTICSVCVAPMIKLSRNRVPPSQIPHASRTRSVITKRLRYLHIFASHTPCVDLSAENGVGGGHLTSY